MDKEVLHLALYSYLKDKGFENTAESFNKDAGIVSLQFSSRKIKF